jgi:FMN reductase
MKNRIKILALTGAARQGSKTTELSKISKKYFEKPEVEYNIFDLQKTPLPIFDQSEKNLNSKNVQLLLRQAKQADGFVMVSPEYHGSMSGAIKNALDWLDYLEDDNFLQGKVAGIMGGGGMLGNSGATIQLMMALRALHAWLMPDVIVNIQKIRNALNENDLVEKSDKERLQKFANSLIKYTSIFKRNKNYFPD